MTNGTFKHYLELHDQNNFLKKTYSLKECIEHIIEFRRDIVTFSDFNLAYTPFSAEAFKTGEHSIRVLHKVDNLESRWQEMFPKLSQYYILKSKNKLSYDNPIFENINEIIRHINETFLTDLDWQGFEGNSVWYLYDESKQKAFPRIAYYHMAMFILSNIVRYEPESLQKIIIEKDDIYWILNRLLKLTDRYFPQLILFEIFNYPIYF
nr:YaaC family protein [Leptospira kemamanensis]